MEAGAVVLVDVEDDVDDEEEVDVDSVVSVTPNEVADAPGDDRPNRNRPATSAASPAQNAASEARRAAETRVTPPTLDRWPLRSGSLAARRLHRGCWIQC